MTSAALPLQDAKLLLLAEEIAAWQDLQEQINAQGARADVFDAVSAALEAMANAAAEHCPYQVIMLAPTVQGMTAEILGPAIKDDPGYKDVLLGILGDASHADMRAYRQAGFSVFAGHATPSQVLLSTVAELCSDGPGKAAFAASATELAPTEESSQPLAGRRILVADDNPVNLQVATRMLEKLGCSVAVATNGLEAVEMVATSGCDLVLMDCEMPHMDGFQATTRIRSLEGNARRIPIVALTALAAQGDREKCLAAGMDDYLSKPVRPQTLNKTLTRWLLQTASPSAPASPEDELEAVQEMFGTDFAELAVLYLGDAPPRIAALGEVWKAGDHVQAARIAHAFAGSSASIGATALAALCKELEINIKAGMLDNFEEKRAAIEAEYQRISSKLRAMLDN